VAVRDGAEEVYVRRATGLVRQGSLLDAMIHNAAVSAPVGATLAFGVFFILSLYPGADITEACLISLVLNIPILLMMALLAATMPRAGGDYIWISRIVSPQLAIVSSMAATIAGLVGTAFFARYFPIFCLGPALSTFGIIFGHPDLIRWGGKFEADSTWIFIGGFGIIVLATLVMLRGAKTAFRWQNVFFAVASIGTALAFFVFLVGSKSDFRQHYNGLSAQYGAKGDAYQGLITSVQGSVTAAPHHGDLSTLLPAVFLIMSFSMWNWWSVYAGGELRGARDRNRQFVIMFGAMAWDVILIAVGVILLYHTVGYRFTSAANVGSDAYVIPSAPWYHFLAALVFDNNFLTVLIVGSFAFWSLPCMLPNAYASVRNLFAWSFDRLLPTRFSDVSAGRGAPTVATIVTMVLTTGILLWSLKAATFQTLVGFSVLAGTMVVISVSVAAFLLPITRRELYESSPAKLSLGGIPLLQIVAPINVAIMCFLIFAAFKWPALSIGSASHRWWVPAYMIGIAVAGLVIFHVARLVRRGEGINVDLVYRELPPD
jgi:APA family basic amino acid/polyamine antiporter